MRFPSLELRGFFFLDGGNYFTFVDGEFSFAGHRTGQVPGCAGVDAGVIGRSVQDDQGTLVVVVHKRVMTALCQQGVILKACDLNQWI